MAGVYKIEISESEVELKELLRQEKTGSRKERIQVLYLLKTKKAKTVTEAAEILGRNRVTVQDWLGKYPETLNPVIKLYIDKHNTPITSNFKLNRQSSGTSVHS
ncbi:helix-turn-helix domain-containing protein [Microcystis aeruginosa]|uniref:helix-turn-helix domain-containing protein n=1 Tax=Microcystis aeruginosa TaxID=1126 RepID=UPI003A0FCB5C